MSPVALAQSGDPDKAKASFDAAKTAYEKGNFRESIRLLKEAHTHYSDPVILLTIAKRWMDLGEPEEAQASLESISTKKQRLKRLVESEMKRVKDALLLPVMLHIDATPAGATVQIDGGKSEKTPFRRKMKRGMVKVSVRADGYEPINEMVLVKGTKTIERKFKLREIIAHLSIELVGVSQESKDGKSKLILTLDKKPAKAGVLIKVKPGKHQVSCGYSGQTMNSVRFKVPENKKFKVKCVMAEDQNAIVHWRAPTAWASVGTGAAVMLAGVGVFVAYAIEASNYKEPQYSIDSSSKPLAGGLATGLGAGLVGFGTYLLLTDD